MTERSNYLAKKLSEVLIDGKWVAGTNVLDTIKPIPFEIAIKRYKGLNSIALLTFHLLYYIEGVQEVFDGNELQISDEKSFHMSPLQSNSDWNNLIDKFEKSARHFIKTVESIEESHWKLTFVLEKYGSFERNIDVMIEHSYYHLGQMQLLLKLHKNSSNE